MGRTVTPETNFQIGAASELSTSLPVDERSLLVHRGPVTYRLKLKQHTLKKGLRRVTRSQLGRALHACQDTGGDIHERVHEVRKRCKKVRALYRLYRYALDETEYKKQNAALREIAASVAGSRDFHVMRRTYDRLLETCEVEIDRKQLAPIARTLTLESDEVMRQELEDGLVALAEPLRSVIERAEQAELRKKSFSVIRDGEKKNYRRARKAMKKAYANPSPERFHELRKRAKYHRYHMRLLSALWPAYMDLREQELHSLTDLLGEDHDMAVFEAWLEEHGAGKDDARAILRGLIEQRRRTCEKEAQLLANRLFCASPKAHSKYLAALYRALG